MSTMATIFNVGRVVKDAAGRTYELRKLSLIEQAQFSVWLEQRAHDAVDRSKATEEAKDRRHAIIDRDAAQGKYEYDGPIAQETLWTPAGLAKACHIALASQGVDEAKAEEIARTSLREVAAQFVARAAADPKLGALTLAALGLPSDWLSVQGNANSSSDCSTPRSDAPTPNSETAVTSNSSSCSPSSAAPTG